APLQEPSAPAAAPAAAAAAAAERADVTESVQLTARDSQTAPSLPDALPPPTASQIEEDFRRSAAALVEHGDHSVAAADPDRQ
ncbi:unnamed protein product, partial [Prorocentrum cordatum]